MSTPSTASIDPVEATRSEIRRRLTIADVVPNRIYYKPDVAQIFDISERTVDRRLRDRDGRLPPTMVKIDSRERWWGAAILRFCEQTDASRRFARARRTR